MPGPQLRTPSKDLVPGLQLRIPNQYLVPGSQLRTPSQHLVHHPYDLGGFYGGGTPPGYSHLVATRTHERGLPKKPPTHLEWRGVPIKAACVASEVFVVFERPPP